MPDKMITKLERKLKKEHLFTGLTSVEGFISNSQSLGFLGLLGKNLALSIDFFPPLHVSGHYLTSSSY